MKLDPERPDADSLLGERLYRDLQDLLRRLGKALDDRNEVEIRRMLSGPLGIAARSKVVQLESDEKKRHLQVVP